MHSPCTEDSTALISYDKIGDPEQSVNYLAIDLRFAGVFRRVLFHYLHVHVACQRILPNMAN